MARIQITEPTMKAEDVVLPADHLTRRVLARELGGWWESMTLSQRLFIYCETHVGVQPEADPSGELADISRTLKGVS